MFEPTSRYAGIAEATIEVAAEAGTTRTIRYKRRRFLPVPGEMTPLTEHTMSDADRLDLVAARDVGDPTGFWRLCDAHDILRPDELERPGRIVVVAMPRP
jgi:hypothetical protein